MHDEAAATPTCPKKQSRYECVITHDWQKWNSLVSTLIAATESVDFCKADKCIKEMESCLFPPWSPADWPTYVEDCRARLDRLRDPLNKDSVFRELLGVYTYSREQAEKDASAACYHIDEIVDPFQPPNRIPFDPSVALEPSDGEFVCDDRITKQVFEKLVELWRLQDCLLFRLRVSEDDLADTDFPGKVAHYCRADVLPSILDEGLRLFSLSSANDPTEGKRFADFLGSGIAGKRDWDQDERMLTLQCSFSSRIDDLNQFRLYGRDSAIGAEGTGLCLVLDLDYFDTRSKVPVATSDAVRHNESETAKNNEEILVQEGVDTGDNGSRLPLYWVLYYDSKRNTCYHTPCQWERPFYVAPDKATTGRSCYFYRNARSNQQAIQRLLEQIRGIFDDLKELNATEAGWGLCVYLRHLIKDAAFRDEQELRLLKLCPLNDDKVEPLTGKGTLSTVYCPLVEKGQFSPLDQIIAGPKVKALQQLREMMRRKCVGVPRTYYRGKKDVIQSQAPLA